MTPITCPNPHCDNGYIRGTGAVGCAICAPERAAGRMPPAYKPRVWAWQPGLVLYEDIQPATDTRGPAAIAFLADERSLADYRAQTAFTR